MDAANHANEPPSSLRGLPSVDHLLKQPTVASLLTEHPRGEVVAAIRTVLDHQREVIRGGQTGPPNVTGLALEIREALYQRSVPHLRRVINATGIVLHTGLGRAPLAPEAIEAIAEVSADYCNLELNLETGHRGDRYDHARDLLRELTGAEDALVVNNNAAGTYLALNTLAAGREVVVARGQLVEIGGSYRMPDIMAAAGCRMIEVGTTNRNRIGDYERAISEETAALLHVHTSNYRVMGFTASASLAELVELGHSRGLSVVNDLGSGLLDRNLVQLQPEADGAAPALPDWDEPSVRESVAAGADLTLFSGDKLLGGPQAGVIVGRAELVARLRKNPLARTFRTDKMTLAGLEATLRLYRDPASLCRRVPVLRRLTVSLDELKAAGRSLADRIAQYLPAATVTCELDESLAGGGSLPLTPFQTCVVVVRPPELDAARVAAALRDRAVPIICRVRDAALVFDCRTLAADDAELIAGALAEVARDLAEA
ncbi:MAG: L-seryl-tRNA(Sec) selenium transferase [Phycisphaerae bacterium]